VAIKIKHPKVEALIARDLAIMGFFARLITLFPGMEWLSLPEEVSVFGSMMNEQLNLRREADNLETFEFNFQKRRDPISFPRPLSSFSAHDVLVEEYQRALPLEAFLKHGGGPFDDQLAELGLDAFLNMLLLDNFVHADLHPGNIMVKFVRPSTRLLLRNVFASLWYGADATAANEQPYSTSESDEIVERLQTLAKNAEDGGRAWRAELHRLHDEGYAPEVVFIDAGLVTTLDARNRANFLDLFRAIAEFDGYRAGQLMVARSVSPKLAREPETFALKIQHLVLDVKRSTFSLGAVRVADVLGNVLKAVRDHHVKMEGDFVNTILSILLLEGIGRQLDPNLDLFASALPILRQLGRQMTEDASIVQMPRQDLGTMFKVREFFLLSLSSSTDFCLRSGYIWKRGVWQTRLLSMWTSWYAMTGTNQHCIA
jgi:aarF domain-containing kinase